MRALVVGYGSIGKRRADILTALGHEVEIVDPRWEELEFSGYKFPSLSAAADADIPPFDVALICTPPDSGRHEQIGITVSMGVKGIFVEKPVALSPEEVSDIEALCIAVGDDVITMGACNLRFVKHVTRLKAIRGWRKHGRFAMSQAAKYWSPDHTPITMALDSIHEIDLAQYLLGPIESIRGNSTDIVADLSIHHEGGHYSHILLDRVGDPPTRFVEVLWEGKGDMVNLMKNDGMYEREMAYFMDCVAKGKPTFNPLDEAAALCEVVMGAIL